MSSTALVPGQDQGFLGKLSRIVLLLALAICVVVPHSFQIPTAIALTIAFLFCLLGLRVTAWLGWLLVIFCAGAVLTVIYLFVGFLNGAPTDAIVQNAIVYIVSPFVWLVLGGSLIQYFGTEGTVQWLIRLTWVALLSVVLFFWAYFTFGREAVQFLTDEANINVRGGFAGSTMLVYGSLIFLAGAIFAEPGLIRSFIPRMAMSASLIAAAATSGRAAFLFAIVIGFAVGLFLRPALAADERASGSPLPLLPLLAMLGAFILGLVALNAAFAQLDLLYIAELFYDKLASGGGNERVQQFYALWGGVEDSYGLGVGHGVGVNYIRNDEFPWRYEILPLATVYRVGFLGLVVYALPFIVFYLRLFQKSQSQSLTRVDIYMAGGLTSALFATFTNPYMESFVFQFMYFIPVVAVGLTGLATSRAGIPAWFGRSEQTLAGDARPAT